MIEFSSRQSIIRKLAFQPPTPPTYILKEDRSRKSGRRIQVITTSQLLSVRLLTRAREAEVFTVRKKGNGSSRLVFIRVPFALMPTTFLIRSSSL